MRRDRGFGRRQKRSTTPPMRTHSGRKRGRAPASASEKKKTKKKRAASMQPSAHRLPEAPRSPSSPSSPVRNPSPPRLEPAPLPAVAMASNQETEHPNGSRNPRDVQPPPQLRAPPQPIALQRPATPPATTTTTTTASEVPATRNESAAPRFCQVMGYELPVPLPSRVIGDHALEFGASRRRPPLRLRHRTAVAAAPSNPDGEANTQETAAVQANNSVPPAAYIEVPEHNPVAPPPQSAAAPEAAPLPAVIKCEQTEANANEQPEVIVQTPNTPAPLAPPQVPSSAGAPAASPQIASAPAPAPERTIALGRYFKDIAGVDTIAAIGLDHERKQHAAAMAAAAAAHREELLAQQSGHNLAQLQLRRQLDSERTALQAQTAKDRQSLDHQRREVVAEAARHASALRAQSAELAIARTELARTQTNLQSALAQSVAAAADVKTATNNLQRKEEQRQVLHRKLHCTLCRTAVRSVAQLPCLHILLCKECFLGRRDKKCVLCQRLVAQWGEVRLDDC